MTRCSMEARTRKYVKESGFFSFERNILSKYGKQLLDTAKTGIDTLKTASQKVVQKAGETKDEFIWNKIANKIVKPKSDLEGVLNELRKVL